MSFCVTLIILAREKLDDIFGNALISNGKLYATIIFLVLEFSYVIYVQFNNTYINNTINGNVNLFVTLLHQNCSTDYHETLYTKF